MNRAVRTGLPERVTSRTSTTPRRRDDLDAPPGLGRHDVERLDALARIDHGLDPVTLHQRMLRRRVARGTSDRRRCSGRLDRDLEGGLVAVAVRRDIEQRHPLALLVDAVGRVELVGGALRGVHAGGEDLGAEGVVEEQLRGELEAARRVGVGPDLEVDVDRPALVPARVDRDDRRLAARVGALVAAQEVVALLLADVGVGCRARRNARRRRGRPRAGCRRCRRPARRPSRASGRRLR